MKILFLTWEFPPLITGGLGMACYGMVKEMLNQGTEVELVLPIKESAYFSLKKPQDADNLVDAFRSIEHPQHHPQNIAELKEIIGTGFGPYHSLSKLKIMQKIDTSEQPSDFTEILNALSEESALFQKVRDFTRQAATIGQKIDYDIIHAHDWLAFTSGVLLKALTRKPLVAHIHATEFDRSGGAGNTNIHNIEYHGMKYADRVVAVSAMTARLCTERYHIPTEKIRVIHNAYTIEKPEQKKKKLFKEPMVLFMGRITIQKGPDYFLEVAKRVLQKTKNVRFVMAGSGDMEKHILHSAAAMGLGTRFLFSGFLNRKEVEKVLSSSDIFMLPSVSEPFGIAPLEAMSYGAVAVISKNAGVAEVIHHAYKVDFWDIDKMVKIIIDFAEDPAKFRQVAAESQEEVMNMKWSDTVKKLAAVFTEVDKVPG